MARMLTRHIDRECRIVRFPHGSVSASLMKYLDLDETSAVAMDALVSQAGTDVSATLSRTGDSNDEDGKLLHELFMQIPPVTAEKSRLRPTGCSAIELDGPSTTTPEGS